MIEDPRTDIEQMPTLRTRRRFTTAQKQEIVRESQLTDRSVAQVAQAHAVNANQLFKWRRQYLDEPPPSAQPLVPVYVEPPTRTPGGPDCQRLEIELGNGCRVIVHGDTSPALLRIALKSLAR